MEEKAKRITNGDGGNQKVAFYKLLTFADRYDIILMAVGTISAMANGLAQPIMSVLIGKIINVFGFFDHDHMVKEVSKVRISNDLWHFIVVITDISSRVFEDFTVWILIFPNCSFSWSFYTEKRKQHSINLRVVLHNKLIFIFCKKIDVWLRLLLLLL